MIEHLIDRTLHSPFGKGEHAENDETHMSHRRISDETLYVRLDHRHKSAIDNADYCESDEKPSPFAALVRKQREVESHQAVRTHFQENRCKYHRPGSWCFGMSVGQPCVKREERHLDRECQRKGEKHHRTGVRPFAGKAHFPLPDGLGERYEIKCADAGDAGVYIIKSNDRREHQQAAQRRENEKLYSRVDAIVTAPDTDKEKHRNERGFEKQVKDQKVEGNEYADHGAFQQQHEGIKRWGSF